MRLKANIEKGDVRIKVEADLQYLYKQGENPYR